VNKLINFFDRSLLDKSGLSHAGAGVNVSSISKVSSSTLVRPTQQQMKKLLEQRRL